MLLLGRTEGIETKASVGKEQEQESPHRIRTPGYPPVTLLPAPGDVKEPPPSAVSPPRPRTTPPPGTETAAAAAVQQTPSLNIINSGLVHNNPGVIIDDTDQTNNNDNATVIKAGLETESSENKMKLGCGTVASDNSEAGDSDNKAAVSGLTPDPALTSVLPHSIRKRPQNMQS